MDVGQTKTSKPKRSGASNLPNSSTMIGLLVEVIQTTQLVATLGSG